MKEMRTPPGAGFGGGALFHSLWFLLGTFRNPFAPRGPGHRDPGAARTPGAEHQPHRKSLGAGAEVSGVSSVSTPAGRTVLGVYTLHTRRPPGPPLRYRRERGRSLQPSERPVRGRAPETLAGGAEGTVAAPGLTPPPAARYSPRLRQRKIPAFWDSGCGIFPPSRHSPRPAARAAAGGTAGRKRCAERGGGRGLAQASGARPVPAPQPRLPRARAPRRRDGGPAPARRG